MEEKEYIALASASIRKKKTIFMSIGIGLFAFAALMILIFILALVAGNEETKSQSGGIVTAMIVYGIMFAVPGAIMLIMMKKQSKRLLDEAKLLEEGKAIYEKKQEKIAAKEEKEAEEEAKRAALEEAKKPDFEADKTFKGAKSYVFLNVPSRLIQFSLPSGEIVKAKDKNALLRFLFGNGEELLKKTKVLSLDDLDGVELLHDTERVTTTNLHGARLHGDYIGSGNGTMEQSTTTYHYYEVEFRFKDIDHPVVDIFFNNDRETASTLYQAVLMLTEKK